MTEVSEFREVDPNWRVNIAVAAVCALEHLQRHVASRCVTCRGRTTHWRVNKEWVVLRRAVYHEHGGFVHGHRACRALSPRPATVGGGCGAKCLSIGWAAFLCDTAVSEARLEAYRHACAAWKTWAPS